MVVTILSSPSGSGLNPRFGITQSLATAAAPDSSTATQITGDSPFPFASLFEGPQLLSSFGLSSGDTFRATANVLFRPNQGASDARFVFRFFSDANNDGVISRLSSNGQPTEFTNRVEFAGSFDDFDANNTDLFQTVSVSGTIPETDLLDNTIDQFEFGIDLPQQFEQSEQRSEPTINDFVSEYSVFIRDITVEGTIIPEPSPSLLLLVSSGLISMLRRR